MRIFVDVNEPGSLYHALAYRGARWRIDVQRSLLHKRRGLGAAGAADQPGYGLGADYVIADAGLNTVAAIERKSLEDLARTITLEERRQPKVFRQLKDLMLHPCPILLIEGNPSLLYRRVEAISLGLQFWAVRSGVSILYSSGPQATVQAVLTVARKIGQELGEVSRKPEAGRPDADELPLDEGQPSP